MVSKRVNIINKYNGHNRYLLLGRVLPVFPTPGCPIIITLIGFCLGISPILLYSVDVMANGGWTTRLDITFMLKQQKKRQKIRGNTNICEVHGQPLCYE